MMRARLLRWLGFQSEIDRVESIVMGLKGDLIRQESRIESLETIVFGRMEMTDHEIKIYPPAREWNLPKSPETDAGETRTETPAESTEELDWFGIPDHLRRVK